MNKYLKNQLDDIFYNTVEISEEKFFEMTEDEQQRCYCDDVKDKPKYYLNQSIELSEEEAKLALLIEQYKYNEKVDKKLNTIMNIIVFWCVLTVIGIVIVLTGGF